MPKRPFSVSVLSGKGGVGKTTISLNLARRLSQQHVVWLIDIDLFNRGTTSAIWESEKDLPVSVAELIQDVRASKPNSARSGFLVRRLRECRAALTYTSNLFVLAAARAEEGREASYLLWRGLNEQELRAEDFLADLLTAVATVSPGCLVVLDGHGGLDELSIGAALASDITYIVNEPDLITFTGSITLYHEISRACRERRLEPHIEFLINRVPPNKSIVKMERDFGAVLRTISPAKEPVAAYFPLERELFGIFGDDPFVSEVYTEYWFSSKIRLIAQNLVDHAVRIGRLEAEDEPRKSKASSRDREKLRTALRREFHKRGDHLLVSWLVFLVVALVANVWSLLQWVLQEGAAKGSPFPGGWTIGTLATVGLILFDQTRRWLRVQRTHIANSGRVRAVRRRLRLGESQATQLREAAEKKAKERVLWRGLRTASLVLLTIGILAALLVPNFLDALQKAKQKRSVADIRNTGTAMFSWLTDQVGSLPAPPKEISGPPSYGFALAANTQGEASQSQPPPQVLKLDQISLISYDDLKALLVPQYMQYLPSADGWGYPFEYRLNVHDPLKAPVMSVRSPGRDGKYSRDIYRYVGFDPTDYDQDLVWGDGAFVSWPVQRMSN